MKIAVAIDGAENALRAAKHERLLSQSPESLTLKREQRVPMHSII